MIQWYRLGDGSLGVDSEDRALAERFETIYGCCATDAPGAGPQVVCCVRTTDPGEIRVRFDDPETLDVVPFIEAVFPGRGYVTAPHRDGVSVRLPDSTHDVLLLDGSLVAPAGSVWQPLVANLAVSRLLRLQREVVFFHAASVRIGRRGLMACGPKRSGKTTLALGLAARGHVVLGDEVAAVRTDDRSLIPFRRSVAARAGPRTAAASALVARAGGVVELFPDGEARTRLAMEAVSPAAPPDRTPLTALVILRSIVPKTQVRPAAVRPELLGALTPLAASLWGRPAGATALRLLRLLSGVRVFEIDSGPPDELVDRVEQLMEAG